MTTESNKPLIFISNDDGVNAKGINELIKAVRSLGEIVVVAPDHARSGMSSAITATAPVRVKKVHQEPDLTIYSCSGNPADCVKIGFNELVSRTPDVLLTGINHGSNSAVAVIYSGTVGASFEGAIVDVPSLAISLTDHHLDADFSEAVKYGKIIAERLLQEGLPKGISLNLNIPNIPEVKGLKICKQTIGFWDKEVMTAQDPQGQKIYWLTGYFANEEPDNIDSDEWALANGYAALTPLQVDMTAYCMIDELKQRYKDL
jgi:5'-nucleotidase